MKHGDIMRGSFVIVFVYSIQLVNHSKKESKDGWKKKKTTEK